MIAIRNAGFNGQLIILVDSLTNVTEYKEQLKLNGANFILSKPVQTAQLKLILLSNRNNKNDADISVINNQLNSLELDNNAIISKSNSISTANRIRNVFKSRSLTTNNLNTATNTNLNASINPNLGINTINSANKTSQWIPKLDFSLSFRLNESESNSGFNSATNSSKNNETLSARGKDNSRNNSLNNSRSNSQYNLIGILKRQSSSNSDGYGYSSSPDVANSSGRKKTTEFQQQNNQISPLFNQMNNGFNLTNNIGNSPEQSQSESSTPGNVNNNSNNHSLIQTASEINLFEDYPLNVNQSQNLKTTSIRFRPNISTTEASLSSENDSSQENDHRTHKKTNLSIVTEENLKLFNSKNEPHSDNSIDHKSRLSPKDRKRSSLSSQNSERRLTR